jgi:predicted nucleic acid-binding protein
MGSGGAEVRPGGGLTLLDANALLLLLRGQPGEAEVTELLRRDNCATPAPCLTEVVDKLIRRWGVSPDHVAERVGALLDESVTILGVSSATAWQAGELRAAHYDRKASPLSLADCTLLATATSDDEVATSDRALAIAARKLGIDLIPLPDSSGRRPDIPK